MSGTADTWLTLAGSWTTATDWSTGVPGSASNATLPGTAAYSITYATSDIINQLDGTDTAATLTVLSGALGVLDGGSFSPVFAQTAGTLTLGAHSDLTLLGGGTLGGAQTGAGELTLASGTYAIAAADVLTVATFAAFNGGTELLLASSETDAGRVLLGSGTTLALGGNTLTLSGPALNPTDSGGDLIGAELLGPGSVVLTGTADLAETAINGAAVLADRGLLVQDNNITVAGNSATDTGTITIAAGAVYDLLDDTAIGSRGTATIINAGLFEKTGVNATSTVTANFSNTGTVLAAAGLIALQGNATLAGLLTGAGEIDLQLGASTLEAGLAVTTGAFAIDSDGTATLAEALSYAGRFALANGSTLFLGGNTLSLGGPDTLSGRISGPGLISTTGTADLNNLTLGGGATLVDEKLFTQDNGVAFGASATDSATLLVAAGATYDLLNDSNISSAGTDALVNAGLFEKTGVTGTSLLQVPFDSTGTLAVLRGAVELEAGGTLAGTLTGSGALILAATGTYVLSPGLVPGVATLELLGDGAVTELTQSLTYAGAFSIVSGSSLLLDGFSLALTGTQDALGGRVFGPGTLDVAGTAEIGGQYVLAGGELLVAGFALEDNFLTLGGGGTDTATLAIAAGATYDFIDDNGINASGTATVLNAGLLEKTGVTGTSTIAATLANTGTLKVTEGVVSLSASSTNTGLITIQNGGFIAQSTLAGGGTVVIGPYGDASFLAAAAQNVAFTGTSGTLEIASPGSFTGTITGFASGDTIELLGIQVNGDGTSGGTLTLTDTVNGTIAASYALRLPGFTGGEGVALVEDPNGGTDIVLNHTGPAFTTPAENIYASNWVADTSGSWATGGNWSTQVPIQTGTTLEPVVPGASDDVAISPTGTAAFAIAYDTTDTVNQLAGSTLGTIDLTGGALTVNQGGGFGGAVVQTGGTLDAVSGLSISGGFSLAAGAVAEVDSLSLAVGSGTLAGTVIGDGELYLIGGDTFVIDPGFSITASSFDLGVNGDGFGSTTTLATSLAYAGAFGLNQYSGNASNLLLDGFTLTLSGQAAFNGAIGNGPGAVVVTGTADVDGLSVGTLAVLDAAGLVTADGLLSLAGTLLIGAAGTYDLLGDVGINENAASVIQNAGLFEKTGADGTSFISVATFLNTGTILADAGDFLINAGYATLGGTMAGPDRLELLGGGTYDIAGTAAVSVGTLELAVNGDGFGSSTTLQGSRIFSGLFLLDDYNGNAAVLDLAGSTLTLTGSANLDGAIVGGGTLAVTGSADISGFSSDALTTIRDTGTVTEDGLLILGNTLLIAAGATYDILADTGINNNAGAAITNAGLFEKTGVDGTSVVSANFSDTGSIVVAAGALLLAGSDTFSSGIAGAGDLIFGGGGSYTLAPGFSITTRQWDLSVNGDGFGSSTTFDTNVGFAGNFSIDDYNGNNANLYLQGNTLTLSGTAELVGGVQGPGELLLSGSADFNGLYDSATVLLTGHATQVGNTNITGSLAIAAGATLDFTADASLGGSPTIANAGLFEKTGIDGLSQVAGTFDNTGTVVVTAGSFQFQGPMANDRTISIGAGDEIEFRTALLADAGSTGTETLAAGAVLQADAAVAASQTIALAGGNDMLVLGTPGSFAGRVADFAAGDTIDLAGITATAASVAGGIMTITNGTLAVGTIALLGSFAGAIAVTSDGNGGTDLTVGANLSGLPASTAAAVQAAYGAYPHTGGSAIATAANAGSFATPVVGDTNIAAFAGFAAGASLALPGGYQIGALLGSLSASLTDTTGNAVLIGNTGNDTLTGAGNSDTLVGGGGNNFFSLAAGSGAVTTGGGRNVVYLGTGSDTVVSTGSDTLVGGSGAATINATAADVAFGATGALAFINGAGASSVVGGSGTTTLFGGSGGGVYFGGAGPTIFLGGSGSASYVGGAGSTTLIGGSGSGGLVFDGPGGGVFVDSSGGNTSVLAGLGISTVFGGGSGDLIYLVGSNNAAVAAGPGNETVEGAASSAANEIYAGSGNDLLAGGSGNDVLFAGTGNATMYGGAGQNAFAFLDGDAGGSDVIADFSAGDLIGLIGYGTELSGDLAAQTSTAAGAMITLSDHTTILFQGVASVSASNFLVL